MKRCLLIFLVIAIGLLVVMPVGAQETDKPVVFALLLFSPSCSHCHNLIENLLPPIQDEFGDSLVILFVNVTTPGGQALTQAVYDTFNVPDDNHVVPMMVVDQTVLVGEVDIPEQLPKITRKGLESGGIDLPPVPGLREAYEQALELQQDSNQTTPQAATASPAETTAEAPANGTVQPTAIPATETAANSTSDGGNAGLTGSSDDALGTFDNRSISEKLAADPIANAMAIAVLIALIVSAAGVLWAGLQILSGEKQTVPGWLKGQVSWGAVVACTVVAFGLAITLTAKSTSDSLATPLAWAVAAILLVVILGVLFQRVVTTEGDQKRVHLPGWLLPLVVVAGIGVAGYLSYVEVNGTEAVCGAVGNCNTVQESVYARLFGILPIGVFGIMGYIAILGAWLLGKSSNPQLNGYSNVLLLAFAVFGVLFSIYLTFLEPFVIGATCAWCLTSAVLMMLVLWLVAGDGLSDLHVLRKRQAK